MTKTDLWALAGIIIVATAYEIDRKAGLLLFFIVFLAMALTIAARTKASYASETYYPPTVH